MPKVNTTLEICQPATQPFSYVAPVGKKIIAVANGASFYKVSDVPGDPNAQFSRKSFHVGSAFILDNGARYFINWDFAYSDNAGTMCIIFTFLQCSDDSVRIICPSEQDGFCCISKSFIQSLCDRLRL